MAITITQTPGPINQAYGINAVTLAGLTSENKYVLRVKQGNNILADIRQAPNIYGNAIFDIQNILQTYVGVGDTDVDTVGTDLDFVPTLTNSKYNLYNIGANRFIGAQTYIPGGTPVSSEINGTPDNTQFTFVNNGQGYWNIVSNENGVLRATGSGFTIPFAIVTTNFAPPRNDEDKRFLFEYNQSNDTYKIKVSTTSQYIYYDFTDNQFKAKGGNTSGTEFQFKFISKGPSQGTPKYRNSFNLGYEYDLEWGTETGGVFNSVGVLEDFEVYPGRKEYYEVDWNILDYTSTIDNGIFSALGLGLTDNKTIKNNQYEQLIRVDDYATVSYLQNINSDSITATGISVMRIEGYDASNNLLFSKLYNNVLNAGGGPYVDRGDAIEPSYPYKVITFGAGPKNLEELDFTNVAYYTVTPNVYYNTGILNTPAFVPHKFIIDNGTCLDYDTIQFSWMNSNGVRDYYTFSKKNQRSVKIKRNEYLSSPVDYNGINYAVGIGDRGATVYSQALSQEYIANTDYISDLDAEWLESLFVSADVRVRLPNQNQFVPAVLTSTSYTQKSFQKDKLFQYEVRFKLANGLKSQRG